MNLWSAAGAAVCAGLVPCALMCLRGSPESRLAGVEMTSMLVTIAMVMFAIASDRLPFIDMPLTLAIMSFGGGLVFARFLGRYL